MSSHSQPPPSTPPSSGSRSQPGPVLPTVGFFTYESHVRARISVAAIGLDAVASPRSRPRPQVPEDQDSSGVAATSPRSAGVSTGQSGRWLHQRKSLLILVPEIRTNRSSTQPLQALTTHLPSTYRICNPNFNYESSRNPRRVLTKPSKGVKNDGYDNEDSDYILYVNDILGSEEAGHKYVPADITSCVLLFRSNTPFPGTGILFSMYWAKVLSVRW